MSRFIAKFMFAIVTSTCLVSGQVSAFGPQLRPFTNQSARFDALMPAGVTNQTIEGKKSLLDTEYRSTVQVDGAKLEVRVRVPIPIKMDDQEFLDNYGEMMVGQAEKQFAKAFGEPSKSIKVTQNGAKGKDFTFRIAGHRLRSGQDLVIRRRVLFDGQRLYQIIAEGTPEVVESDQVTKFIDSVGPML